MSTDTDSLDEFLDELFAGPRQAALSARVDEIHRKLEEWDDKINLGGPSKDEEHRVLWAAIHALEELHRHGSWPDITRSFALWVKSELMEEICAIDGETPHVLLDSTRPPLSARGSGLSALDPGGRGQEASE